jgi:hypothetical protein
MGPCGLSLCHKSIALGFHEDIVNELHHYVWHPACKQREGSTRQLGACGPPIPGAHPVLRNRGGQGAEMGVALSPHPG